MTTTEITEIVPREDLLKARNYLQQIRDIIKMRPDKLVINGKQYLFFFDWQMLARWDGITPYVVSTETIFEEEPRDISGNLFVFKRPIGFKARAQAMKGGAAISSAEAECLFDEPGRNWKSKPRNFALSMAQTRAMAKALRNCLQWVVKLPGSEFAEETAEEAEAETQNGQLI